MVYPSGHGDLSVASLLTIDETHRCIAIADATVPDMPTVYVSEAFRLHTGYMPGEVLGRNCRFLQGPNTDPGAVAAIRLAIAASRPITLDILNYRKDGAQFWNRMRVEPMFDRSGRVRFYVGIQKPIRSSDVRLRPVNAIED